MTCAACHTGEITHHGKTLRVDGGQGATSTWTSSRTRSKDAILWTGAKPERIEAFKQRAAQFGFPADRVGPAFEARYRMILAEAPDRERIAAEGTLAGPGRNDAFAVATLVVFNYAIDVSNQSKQGHRPGGLSISLGISGTSTGCNTMPRSSSL